MFENADFLQVRLEHARRRLDDATPHSPDWEAASEAVDDLKRRLEHALNERRHATIVAAARRAASAKGSISGPRG